jgi:hypothetical protein
MTRQTCDEQFLRCLQDVCRKVKKSARSECMSSASLYHSGTTLLGCNAYLASQREACTCGGASTDL